ncbi:MAG TPA: hypothetical protein VJ806_08420 [Luteimonas sp.]|nr:hypothetical protein [Luteimonas sp.]
MATARTRKSASAKKTAKKKAAVAKKAAKRRPAAKKAVKKGVKKVAKKKVAARKAPAKKAAVKKVAKKSAAKKSVAKKAAAKRSAAKKVPAKKVVAKKEAAAKKTVAKKDAAKKPLPKKLAKPVSPPTVRPAAPVSKAAPAPRPAADTGAIAEPAKISPEQALANTRALLEAKKQHDREPQAWHALDREQSHTPQPGPQSPEAAAKAEELHQAESRVQAIQGSISTQDRHNQGKRDSRDSGES